MTCYIVVTDEPTPRYGNRNKLMNYSHNAVVYSSPSAAKITAKRLLIMHPQIPAFWVCVYNSDRHPDVRPVLVTRAAPAPALTTNQRSE